MLQLPNDPFGLTTFVNYTISAADPATGDYVFFCGGVQIASGTGTLTVKGCQGSIDHNKGDRRVHMEWDTAAEGKGKGTAIVQLGVNNTRCQITDKSLNDDTCTAPPQVVAPVEGRPGKRQSQN